MLRSIPGIDTAVPTVLDLNSGITGKAKLLLEYLIQSPIEIVLKEQRITQDVLNELSLTGERHEN